MRLLAALPIKRVAAPLEQVLALAVKHSLSSYDALYLGLALNRRLPVATLDEALTRAARAERLQVLGA
jgi:predicted nucleic acid-binding protein